MVGLWSSLSASSSTTSTTVSSSTHSQCSSFQFSFSFSCFYYYYYCGLLVVALSTLNLPGFGPYLSTGRFAEGKVNMAEKKIRIDGDVVFGGLFPMHEKGQGGKACGNIKKEKGIQRMEAMLFAIDRINRNPNLLSNIRVGVHILDTCSFDTYALEQSMDFIRARNLDMTDYTCTDGRPPQYLPKKPVIGVIGAASSLVSIMVANILRLFKRQYVYQKRRKKAQLEAFIAILDKRNIHRCAYASTPTDTIKLK